MRKSKRQLNAISYAITKRMREKQEKYIVENGLEAEYKASKYKTMTWFLKSKGVNIY